MRILLSESAGILQWNDYADQLLRRFVSLYPILYSRQLMTFNVHSLIHISKDAQKFGKLDNISAFPFENEMQIIKRMLRSKRFPMQQIVNRIQERQSLHKLFPKNTEKKNEVVINSMIVRNRRDHNTEKRDNCVLLSSGECVIIEEINDNQCTGRKFRSKSNLYSHPCNSQLVQIYVCTGLNEIILFKKRDVKFKCYLLPYVNADEFVCVTML
jgi:hypothetical protein